MRSGSSSLLWIGGQPPARAEISPRPSHAAPLPSLARLPAPSPPPSSRHRVRISVPLAAPRPPPPLAAPRPASPSPNSDLSDLPTPASSQHHCPACSSPRSPDLSSRPRRHQPLAHDDLAAARGGRGEMLRLRAFRPTSDKVVKIQLHPTHPWLVTADANDRVSVWDWEHRQLIYELKAGGVDERRLVDVKLEKLAEGDTDSKGKPTEAIRGGRSIR